MEHHKPQPEPEDEPYLELDEGAMRSPRELGEESRDDGEEDTSDHLSWLIIRVFLCALAAFLVWGIVRIITG